MISRYPLARAGLAAACALILAGSTLAQAAVPLRSRPGWRVRLVIHYLPATNHSQYNAVIGTDSAAWFFGGSNLGGSGVPVIELRERGSWQSAALPAGLHSWIAAASASSATDVWAVTHLGGTVLRWNGTAWTAVPDGGWPTVNARFTGVTALARHDVWLFGAGRPGQPGTGTWSWDGVSWRRARAPAGQIYQASADSRSEMWAVGEAKGAVTAVLRYDNGIWRRVAARALAGLRYTSVLAESPRSVWLAGSAGRGKPRLAHWDGRRWAVIRAPGPAPPASLCPDGRGGIWAVPGPGGRRVMLRYARRGGWSTWQVNPAGPASRIISCSRAAGTSGIWGAGVASAPPGSAAAAYAFGHVP